MGTVDMSVCFHPMPEQFCSAVLFWNFSSENFNAGLQYSLLFFPGASLCCAYSFQFAFLGTYQSFNWKMPKPGSSI